MTVKRSALIIVLTLLAAACGGGSETAAIDTWDDAVNAAEGQTVQLWMWGGDSVLNDYINTEVTAAAAAQGVTLEQRRVDSTTAAIDQIVSEAEAGVEDGSVDLVWVNGSNFAQVKEAGLWRSDWVSLLPNAVNLDSDDPTLFNDFTVPTDGQEAPWSRAAFTFAYNTDAIEAPPASFTELAAWVARNPGRFTYPAPPDFTGSAFVRQAVQALGEDDAFALLEEIRPNLWSEGSTFPKDEGELNQLFGNGEVDMAMSYNPNFVEVNVRQGVFPEAARPFVLGDGTLQNVSFLAMPANAGSAAGAMVVMNELLSVELQSVKLSKVGVPAVVDVPAGAGTEYQLTDFGVPLEELPSDRVTAIDERWRTQFLS